MARKQPIATSCATEEAKHCPLFLCLNFEDLRTVTGVLDY